MLRCFHRHSWRLGILDELCLWRFGRSVNTEGSGFRKPLGDSIKTGYVLVANLDFPLSLLVQLFKLLSSEWFSYKRSILGNGRGNRSWGR